MTTPAWIFLGLIGGGVAAVAIVGQVIMIALYRARAQGRDEIPDVF